MRLKFRYDEESEKFYKLFWKLNKAYIYTNILWPVHGSDVIRSAQYGRI